MRLHFGFVYQSDSFILKDDAATSLGILWVLVNVVQQMQDFVIIKVDGEWLCWTHFFFIRASLKKKTLHRIKCISLEKGMHWVVYHDIENS